MEWKKQAVSEELILTSLRLEQELCKERIRILCSRFDAKYSILLCVCEDQHETFNDQFIKCNKNCELYLGQ